MPKQLTREQARKVHAKLWPYANYLIRLRERMELTGFAGNDPLYQKTLAAQTAIQDLTMELHYQSCQSGVGRSE